MSDVQLLEVAAINSYYGKSHILHDVSLHVEQGEIVTLLGLNGAGKTTTLRSILGLTPPRSGSVRLNGHELRGRAPHAIVRLGVGYVGQGLLRRQNASST
jgi:branched-chain amino acid transport system ATP-binding protein